jgi:probable addiction module antidote protein
MVKTEPFDAALYLTSPSSQEELLNDALASGDACYVSQALGVIARARGMTEVAREAGGTREALYQALSENGDPRLTTLLGVARALGVTLTAHVDAIPQGGRECLAAVVDPTLAAGYLALWVAGVTFRS